MGGGAPSIDGGMSEEQYRRLQMEERQFMVEQEERQMSLMNEMEDKRVQREKAEMQKQERLRSKEEEALSALEATIGDEVAEFGKQNDKEDKDLVMDFYGSLAKNNPGVTTDPQGGSMQGPTGTYSTGTSGGRAGGRPR
tara:strand:- start:13369 stop:13785 length:417 start_codon:yes stop_codon:yes gene_type:complete